MKKFVKNGIEKLPLVYQLADVIEIKKASKVKQKKDVRPNRSMKLNKYNSEISDAWSPEKPISKII